MQIHVAALNDLLQMLFGDAVFLRQWQQSLHHRVLRLTGKTAGHFKTPPLEFLRRDSAVLHLIHHVIHLAAKRIKRGDGGAFARR